MASNHAALPSNGVQAVRRRHGAHDSALDDDEHNEYGAAQNWKRIEELEEENGLLAQKATAACMYCQHSGGPATYLSCNCPSEGAWTDGLTDIV